MKTNQIFTTAFLAAAMAFSSYSVFAQVKIGTNPTVINAANNLEVEASTTGRKTSINKTTGQVTIADGTEGAKKIFTSDPVGGGSWQTPASQNSDVWIYVKGVANQNMPIGVTRVDFASIVYDRGGNFDLANDRIVVPSTGIYQLSTGLRKNGYASSGYNMILGVYVNNVAHTFIYEDGADVAAELRATGSLTLQLNANDVVELRLTSNFATFFIGQGYLTFIKLSN